MAVQFNDDFIAHLIHLLGFRPYQLSPAVPEYVQNEILEEETPTGIDLYAVQRPHNVVAASVIVLQCDLEDLKRYVFVCFCLFVT
jgi:hypothetical protein